MAKSTLKNFDLNNDVTVLNLLTTISNSEGSKQELNDKVLSLPSMQNMENADDENSYLIKTIHFSANVESHIDIEKQSESSIDNFKFKHQMYGRLGRYVHKVVSDLVLDEIYDIVNDYNSNPTIFDDSENKFTLDTDNYNDETKIQTKKLSVADAQKVFNQVSKINIGTNKDQWVFVPIDKLNIYLIIDPDEDNLFVLSSNSHGISSYCDIYDSLAFNLYKFDGSIDEMYHWALNQLRNNTFKANKDSIVALKQFWIAQNKKHQLANQNYNDNEDSYNKVSKNLQTILDKIIDNYDNNNMSIKTYTFKYQELIDFYHEVKNGNLTNNTAKVQEWIFQQDIKNSDTDSYKSIIELLSLRKNFDERNQNIQEIDISDVEFNKLYNDIEKDKVFKTKPNIKNIYRLNEPEKPKIGENVSHFIGAHGTNAFSIPTILFDGFKTNSQLAADLDAKYSSTAQSLGDGTYFAKLSQITKAINYTGSKDSFVVISDIQYQKPITTTTYNSVDEKKDYDFVIAESLNNTHGYNEYVARYPQKQVTPKYLVIFGNN